MSPDELKQAEVEAMRLVISDKRDCGGRGCYGEHCWCRNIAVEAHDAAARVREEAGFVTVPREPTIGMRKVSTFEAAELDWPSMLAAHDQEG